MWISWLLGWFWLLAIASVNGTVRAVVTQPLLGETAARAFATVILPAGLTVYGWWLHRRQPIPTALVPAVVRHAQATRRPVGVR